MQLDTIQRIVEASGVSAGELILVHFWGEDADKQIANDFMTAVAAQGATPVLLQQSRSNNRALFSAARESSFDARYYALFESLDAVLDVFAYRPIVLGHEIEPTQYALYRNYIATLFYQLMKCKRFTQIRIPTAENAAESHLAPEDYVRRMTAAYDIDYQRLAEQCRSRVEQLQSVSQLVLRTGESCTLYLSLDGRPWHIDAGDGDLPCGEVYIAPLEDKSHGTVFFDQVYWNDEWYQNVTMRIRDGKLTDCSAPAVMAYFAAQPEGERVLCELGFGMNPNVTERCGYPLLDEKMCGTFHIAFGANQMFGGTNAASDHLDFVGFGKVEVIYCDNKAE